MTHSLYQSYTFYGTTPVKSNKKRKSDVCQHDFVNINNVDSSKN